MQHLLHVPFFISLIRMRSKRDIKMGRLCTPGGAVLGIVGGGVRFRFLNGEAIFEEYMLFWVRLYALVVVLKIPLMSNIDALIQSVKSIIRSVRSVKLKK